jgi:hypothetical protein
MTAAVLDAVGLAHLVAVVQRCRRDWDAAGIRRYLEAALGRHPYPDVALVAIASARDRTAKTPAVIPTRCANGWTGNDTTEPRTPGPPRVADMRCRRCNAWLIADYEDLQTHTCKDRADPDHARAMRDAAKAAIIKPTTIRNNEEAP